VQFKKVYVGAASVAIGKGVCSTGAVLVSFSAVGLNLVVLGAYLTLYIYIYIYICIAS
jgi:hypothetical protein